MDLVHLTLSVTGRYTLARDERETRTLLRLLARVVGPWLALFCVVDDHLHAVLRALHPRRIARDLRAALLAARQGLALDPPHLKPIEDRDHLERVLPYLLRQPLHHGLPGHPALWAGSCFADLIDARALPGFSSAILTEELPRLHWRDLFRMVGLEPEPLIPANDASLRGLGPAGLIEVVSGALSVDPQLLGRSAPVSQARALVAGIASRLELPMVEVARALGVTRQSVHESARKPLDPQLTLAIRIRAAYLARCRAAPYPTWLLPQRKR